MDCLSRESFGNGFAELLPIDLTKRGPVLSASRIFALEQNVRPSGMTANADATAAEALQVGERAGVEIAHQEAGAFSPACAVRAQIQSEQKSSLLNKIKHIFKMPKTTRARDLDDTW